MRRNLRKFGVGAALLAVAALAMAAVDGFDIKRSPKEGETTKYRLKADIEAGGGTATLTSLSQEKITKVDADGKYTVETTQLEGKLSFNGQDIDFPTPPPEVTVYAPGGKIAQIKGDFVDGNRYRVANMGTLFEPGKTVNVGDAWTYNVEADDKTGAVASKVDYKVLSEEKVGDFDTLKIQFSYKETTGSDPASCEGTMWLSKADWTLVKLDSKYVNAPFPGAPGPTNASIQITRE